MNLYSINKLSILLFKHMIAALLIAITIGNVAAQSNSEEISLTEEERSWIAEHPKITASNNISFAPYDFVSAGEPAGLSIDYLNLLTAKVGLKVEYVNFGSFYETLKMAMEQKIDVIHTLSKNDERQEHFNFSTPYFIDQIALYGRVGSEKIDNIKDLKDKRIGLVKGQYISSSYQKHYPDLNYVEFNNNREGLRALISNKIDVYPYDIMPVEYAISQNDMHGIEIIGDEFIIENSEIDSRVAVHKNNPMLMSILNKSIASVTDEEFEIVFDKWVQINQTTQGFKLTSKELDWLADNKIIKVSADKHSFPLEFINEEGEISGISGDFLNEISKQLNVKFVWAGNQTWLGGLLNIQSPDTDIDMVSGITPTRERRKFLEFSDVYLNLEFVIVSRDESVIFSNINALDGKTVAQVKGTAVISYLSENYPNINIIETKTRRETLELVSSGGADAMIADVTRALSNISNYGFENLSISGTTPYVESTAMAVSPELPLLSSALQKALVNIDSETRNAISTKWFTQRVEAKVDYGPLYYVIGIAVFGVIIVLLWNRKLRGEILRRQASENSLVNSQESLINALKEAKKANASKSDFLANMSHEIRTPLNAIIGFAEALEMGIGAEDKEKRNESLRIIADAGRQLNNLISDILDFSKIEAGKVEFKLEAISPSEIFKQNLPIIRNLAEKNNISFQGIKKTDKKVLVDRSRMSQILLNFITNAIKYNRPNGSLEFGCYEVEDDKLKIYVKDTGVGIQKDKKSMLFSPFDRIDTSLSTGKSQSNIGIPGIGLGLSICKKLTESMEGTIGYESEYGEGSTFWVIFPTTALDG